mgnify:CR=1 FL=1
MTSETLLHRQVNPSWIQAGRISSQVFRPTLKDEKLLSVYDGDLIRPENAWVHFVHVLGFRSIGVVAVTMGECQSLDLPVRPDQTYFPEHAVIDFSACSGGEIERKAKYLKVTAEARGWLYQYSGGDGA